MEIVSRLPSWRFVTGGRISHASSVDTDGSILCASDERVLYCIDAAGEELWRLPLPSRPIAAPLVSNDGTVYQAVSGGILAVRPSGSVRWTIDLGGALAANPAMAADGALYVPLERGELVALDYAGGERWRFRFKADISCSPAVTTEARILICTIDRLYHALDSSGTQAWTVALPAVATGTAVGSDGSIYVSAFGIHAFAEDGTPLWEYAAPSNTTPPALMDSGYVVVGCSDGSLYLLTPRGELQRQIELDSPLVGGVAVAGGVVYASTAAASFLIVDTVGGEAAEIVCRDAVTAPAVRSISGLAVVGSKDWVLYAYDPPVPISRSSREPWMQWMGDQGRTGRAGATGGEAVPEYLILDEMARSSLRVLKTEALSRIARFLGGEEYLPLPARSIEAVVGLLVAEGVTSPVYVGGGQDHDFPLLRAESCRLLGELGTRGARTILVGVVENDPSIEVQSAAVRSLGVLGPDPAGRAARAISVAVGRTWESGALLKSGLEALASIARAGPVDPAGQALLVRIASEASTAADRRAARDALRTSARWAWVKENSDDQ